MMTDQDRLAQLSRQIGLHEPMTVEELISSYMNVRNTVHVLLCDCDKEWLSAKQKGYQAGLDSVKDQVIEISKLQDMTLAQIAKLIG